MPRFTNRYPFNRAYSQRIHARNRARERYSLDLSPALAIRIGEAVRDGRATPLGGSVYSVDLQPLNADLPDVAVIVAYDRKRRQVATFLPHDWTPEKAAQHRGGTPRKPKRTYPSLKDYTEAQLVEWIADLQAKLLVETDDREVRYLRTCENSARAVLRSTRRNTNEANRLAKEERRPQAERDLEQLRDEANIQAVLIELRATT